MTQLAQAREVLWLIFRFIAQDDVVQNLNFEQLTGTN